MVDPVFPRWGYANPRGGHTHLFLGFFLPKTAWKWNKLDCSLNLCLSLSLNGWMAKSNTILSTLTCHVTVAEILFVRLGWIKSANSEKSVEQLNANSPFDWLYSHLTNSNSASVLLLNCHSAIQTQTQTEPEVFWKHAPTYYCGQISIKMKKKIGPGKECTSLVHIIFPFIFFPSIFSFCPVIYVFSVHPFPPFSLSFLSFHWYFVPCQIQSGYKNVNKFQVVFVCKTFINLSIVCGCACVCLCVSVCVSVG